MAYSAEDISKMLTTYEQYGRNATEAARILKSTMPKPPSRDTILKYARLNGHETNPPGGRRVALGKDNRFKSEEEIRSIQRRIFKVYEATGSIAETAEILDIDWVTAKKYLKLGLIEDNTESGLEHKVNVNS